MGAKLGGTKSGDQKVPIPLLIQGCVLTRRSKRIQPWRAVCTYRLSADSKVSGRIQPWRRELSRATRPSGIGKDRITISSRRKG